MTCLADVATYLPPRRVSIDDHLRGHGFSESRIRLHERYFGFSEIRFGAGTTLAEDLVAAGAALESLSRVRHRIRYVLHGRTMPVVAPYPANPLQEARRKLGLEHAQAFSVTQHACASSLLAVDLAGRMLAGAGDEEGLVLVLSGEKAFTSCAQVIVNSGVMGEGTTAVLVGADGRRDRMLSYATRTYGEFHDGAWLSEEAEEHFQQLYPSALAEVIRAATEHAGLELDQIELILPHNVNRMSWLRVLRRLGLRRVDRLFLDNLPRTGHCFGADAFANYRTARDQGRLQPGHKYVMTAVGLGATFSAMTFEH
ncbi:3-oxoacyl-[acyl-carrier-protein] synthase III C-terminal domain-containing protein [Streptomyces sp. NPDC020731]|uniref:3-oxoacyl-[acyl-carrier-protein] synthase III C-terminal domain-containing protein n=1 Tax=Streptomyces sp. NPDC020731 TaxID=3365085 RepID=UPI0037A483AA